jgi:hypothetical protein
MTPHFTLDELTHTDHRELDNTPNESEIANIQRLAEFLEQVKDSLGRQAHHGQLSFQIKGCQ